MRKSLRSRRTEPHRGPESRGSGRLPWPQRGACWRPGRQAQGSPAEPGAPLPHHRPRHMEDHPHPGSHKKHAAAPPGLRLTPPRTTFPTQRRPAGADTTRWPGDPSPSRAGGTHRPRRHVPLPPCPSPRGLGIPAKHPRLQAHTCSQKEEVQEDNLFVKGKPVFQEISTWWGRHLEGS